MQCEGVSIQTVESLAGPDGALHPIQEAFHRCHALQCGFCTPGFLMAVYAFLADAPARQNLTDDEIREAISGNLCRCTGYTNIVDAVRHGRGADGLMSTRSFGERILRNEDDRLLRGAGMFVDDIAGPGVLHAAFVRSEYAHADADRRGR